MEDIMYKDSDKVGWKLPEPVSPFHIDNFFDSDMYQNILFKTLSVKDWGPYHTISGRWSIEIDLEKEVWDYLEKQARQLWKKDDIRLKNIWFAKYQRQNGVTPYLWKHMDQAGSQYLMDICIKSHDVSWSVIVDEINFQEKENSALCFMAQQQAHSRPPYPSESDEAYVIVMFALFADSSHWVYDIDMYDDNDIKKWNEGIKNYYSDADVRYYEKYGTIPSHENLPEGNYECQFLCTQCYVGDPNFLEKYNAS